MSSYPLGEELAGVIQKRRASMTLQDQVAQLFEEARNDVYRYLLSLGLYPPQAQEAAQEYRRAIESFPTFALAHFNLGLLLLQQGDAAEAIPQARGAVG